MKLGRKIALAPATALLLAGVIIPGSGAGPLHAEKRGFDFRTYCGLRLNKPFRVNVRRAGEIGEGKVRRLNRRNLDLEFAVRGVGRKLTGRVRLRYVRRDARRVYLRLRYSGSRDGKKESSREIVQADSFLARNGILTFKYLRGKRFLQIGKGRDGRTRITTDWGTATLRQ